MSILVQYLPLIVYTVWMVRRASRSRPATSVAPPLWRATGATVRHATGAATALGLEDDPDQWHPWTALDEHQLIRLLSDSAPRHRPAPNGVDEPPVERGATP